MQSRPLVTDRVYLGSLIPAYLSTVHRRANLLHMGPLLVCTPVAVVVAGDCAITRPRPRSSPRLLAGGGGGWVVLGWGGLGWLVRR